LQRTAERHHVRVESASFHFALAARWTRHHAATEPDRYPALPTQGGTNMAMTLKDALAQLKALGNEKVRAQNKKHGAGDNQFGVRHGDIRKVAAKIKTNDQLAIALWNTENVDARLLAILLIKPKNLPRDVMDRMVWSVNCVQVADWLNSYVVKNHPDKESLRHSWMEDDDPWAARAGWSLTSERIVKNADGLDLPALLDRIESELGNAASEVQWTMNFCLAGIGIHFPKHRKRTIAIGETLGIYRDYPVSKGCTSPFAPIWINEMVRRQS
jgi:3-methyladenine DNA glycosylase AlkD